MGQVRRSHYGSKPPCKWCADRLTDGWEDYDLAPWGVCALHPHDKCQWAYRNDFGEFSYGNRIGKVMRIEKLVDSKGFITEAELRDAGYERMTKTKSGNIVLAEIDAGSDKTKKLYEQEWERLIWASNELKQDSIMLRTRIDKNGKNIKTPDFLIGGYEWETKTIYGKEGRIEKRIKEALKQTDDKMIIIEIDKKSPLFNEVPVDDIMDMARSLGVMDILIKKEGKEIANFSRT
jgi:hypothetical protein